MYFNLVQSTQHYSICAYKNTQVYCNTGEVHAGTLKYIVIQVKYTLGLVFILVHFIFEPSFNFLWELSFKTFLSCFFYFAGHC